MKASTLTNRAPSRAVSPVDTQHEGLSREALHRIYRTMLLSRRLDDKEIQLKNQSLSYFQISCAGHEAVLVAAALVLRPGYDWFYPYYRDRALCLTLRRHGIRDAVGRGGCQGRSELRWAADACPLEPRSRSTSCPSRVRRPRSACTRSVAPRPGRLYERLSGIENRASKFHDDEVVYVSLGEGATSEGEFWESLNTACTDRLPVVYLIEDNDYAISVPVEVQMPGGDLSRLVESFPNLHLLRVDGTDAVQSYRTMRDAVAYARARKGPALVHAKVIRPYSHSMSDDEKLYKDPAERQAEAKRDPLVRFPRFLRDESLATEAELAAIAADVDREVADATERALRAEKPRRDTAQLYIFSPDVDPTSTDFDQPAAPEGKPVTMVTAINQTLKDEMSRDPRLIIFGEDVADCSRSDLLAILPGKGGVFKVTHGLQRAFGEDRVFNSPLAEANIVGRAVGMAIRGLRPVVEIQFFDYIWPAVMQLRNEMAMLRYRSNNVFSCPMVVRVPIGGYLRGGALYHSQSGESIFAHCPGLRIVYPSDANDAAGLLRTAIRCDDPVLFLEHKHLYRQTYNKQRVRGSGLHDPLRKVGGAS